MGDLVRLDAKRLVPATVAELGRKAERTFVEFFVAHLSNEHTRRAYGHAVAHLSDWLEMQGWSLAEIKPVEAAAYIEFLKHEGKATSTIKARLAALRNLCDYMTSKGVLEWNPFSVVRAPRMSAGEGKTPILEAEDVRALFESIGTEDVIDLRDRAILSLMLYTFARVGAVVKLDGRHYEAGTARASIALHEKRGRFHRVPCHHQLHEAMEAFLVVSPAGPRTPVFRAAERAHDEEGRRQLSRRRIQARSVLKMVKRRAAGVGLPAEAVCNHSFRGTGITNFMENGGSIDVAAGIAAHSSTKTTQLYDRSVQTVQRDEIERVRF
jgi:site-specific recombinase XerD